MAPLLLVTVTLVALSTSAVGRAQTAADVTVVTLAGSGAEGFLDGSAASAQFAGPDGIAVDAAGAVYIADGARIRRVTPPGTVTTLAGGDGNGFDDGPATAARFDAPAGLAVDLSGAVYVADRDNHRIRRIAPDGTVSTLAGTGEAGFGNGPTRAARFNSPAGVAVDGAGAVYVADSLNHCIRRISTTNEVTTFAGGCGEESGDFVDGPATVARFSFPLGIAVDRAGTVYVADTYNARVRRITATGEVTTLAGSGLDGSIDGPAGIAQFSDPLAIAIAPDGAVIVVDKGNRIRLITPDGAVATLAGTSEPGFADGPGDQARFNAPSGVAVDAAGIVYVADAGNHRIRAIRSQ